MASDMIQFSELGRELKLVGLLCQQFVSLSILTNFQNSPTDANNQLWKKMCWQLPKILVIINHTVLHSFRHYNLELFLFCSIQRLLTQVLYENDHKEWLSSDCVAKMHVAMRKYLYRVGPKHHYMWSRNFGRVPCCFK